MPNVNDVLDVLEILGITLLASPLIILAVSFVVGLWIVIFNPDTTNKIKRLENRSAEAKQKKAMLRKFYKDIDTGTYPSNFYKPKDNRDR